MLDITGCSLPTARFQILPWLQNAADSCPACWLWCQPVWAAMKFWNQRHSPRIHPEKPRTRSEQHMHAQHATTLNKQWYKTQVHSQSDSPEHTPRPRSNWLYCTQIKRTDSALSGWRKENKSNQIKKHSQRSYSSPLSAPNEGWSVIQDSSAVLGESQTEIQYCASRLCSNASMNVYAAATKGLKWVSNFVLKNWHSNWLVYKIYNW